MSWTFHSHKIGLLEIHWWTDRHTPKYTHTYTDTHTRTSIRPENPHPNNYNSSEIRHKKSLKKTHERECHVYIGIPTDCDDNYMMGMNSEY